MHGTKTTDFRGHRSSVIPSSDRHALKPALFELQAANGSHIETHDKKTLTLNIGMRRV